MLGHLLCHAHRLSAYVRASIRSGAPLAYDQYPDRDRVSGLSRLSRLSLHAALDRSLSQAAVQQFTRACEVADKDR